MISDQDYITLLSAAVEQLSDDPEGEHFLRLVANARESSGVPHVRRLLASASNNEILALSMAAYVFGSMLEYN